MKTKAEQQKRNANCRPVDLARAQEQCQVAFRALAWAKCATHVALEPFLLDCAYNLCESGDLNRSLCESLQAFGVACQAQGLKPPIWRNSSFCRECPPMVTPQQFPNPVSVCRSFKTVMFSFPIVTYV